MQESAIDNTQWQQHGDDATDTTDDEERRPADDGNYYTQNEFLMFYNGDPTMWELCAPNVGVATAAASPSSKGTRRKDKKSPIKKEKKTKRDVHSYIRTLND